MPRSPKIKELKGTKIANAYGGWIYCEHCGENIGYLCYVTYDNFRFRYQCKCGSCGSMHIDFGDSENAKHSESKLINIKNRQCCPNDSSPLLTILEKKLTSYQYEIDCIKCQTKYMEDKNL